MCETRNSIGVGKAEEAVIKGLKDIANNSSIQELAPVPTFKPDSSSSNTLKIQQLEKRLIRAKEAYLAGIDSLVEYKSTKSTLETEIERLKAMTFDIPAAEPITREKVKSVYEFLENSDVVIEKSQVLHSVVEYIVYDKAVDSMEFFLK